MQEIQIEKLPLKKERNRNKEYWREIIEEWKNGNENQKEFCNRLGIKIGTFTHWRSVFSSQDKLKENKFIAVKVTPHITRPPEQLMIELPSGCKLTLPLIEEEVLKVFNLLGLRHA